MTDIFQLNDVRFSHDVTNVINIDQLIIPEQACTVILGDNGAGKTTLLSLLGFILTPVSGTILYCGQQVSTLNNLSLRRRIATLHQRPYLFRGSVLDNAALALKLRGATASVAKHTALQALRQVGCSDLAARPANSLSGGEAQRVALARCLATKPEVLLLDEPFSHLDQFSVKMIKSVINHFVKQDKGTVVFSTHDHALWPELADHIVTLEHGRITNNQSVNTLYGQTVDNWFETGQLRIKLPDQHGACTSISIDPTAIVIVKTPDSGFEELLNYFPARVVGLTQQRGYINVIVDVEGERLQVWQRHNDMNCLEPGLGSDVWIRIEHVDCGVQA
ncbi:MAG: ABC transporter ATP-binding protein [Methylococcales bacterium]